MIVGTGIDIAEVDRIANSIERFGRRFLERVFTPDEIRYCESRPTRQSATPDASPPRRPP
jgi:holo-[acyl-carrier protein] synthase